MSRSASEAIRFAAARAPFDGWTVVEVSGRHRERFLHSQVTSDLRSLPSGASQVSALLDAAGRLQSFFHLQKLDGIVRLLVPDDAVRATVAGLQEHVIADDVHIAALEVGPMWLALGPASTQVRQTLPTDRTFPVTGYGASGLVVWGDANLQFPSMAADELEHRRVLSGLPRWGTEAVAGMLVNETTLVDTAVSFTKGCYLGQETVAKVASRRGAAYAPMLLQLSSGRGRSDELVGRDFSVGERRRAGTVRSHAAWEKNEFLLAFLWRELRVEGSEIRCRFGDGCEVSAVVSGLPLITAPSADDEALDLYHRAVELFTADDADRAIELLERAIAVCPGFADAYESLGVILGRFGRYEEAIELMDGLLRAEPDSVMAHTNKSVYLNQLGRNEEAEQEARAAAAKSFELSQRRSRAAADDARRQHDEVEAGRRRREEMFRQVLELDPGDAMASFGMGQLLVERGELEPAVGHLRRALESDPGYSAAFLTLGGALERLGDPVMARDTYREGVRVAARKGDMKTANAMQQRLAELTQRTSI